MILKPPFQLMGREGAGLDAGLYFLGALGIDDAVLKTRSLGVGELTFSMRAWSGRPVPDNEQWLTLQDANRQTLMVGLAKRTYRWPEKEYSFVVSDVYKGLLEAPCLEGDRAFVLYPEQDLAARLLNILQRGIDLGLPIQAPATMPELYPVPKQAFRARSVGEALEEALKWAPDVGTKMDYTTLPYPTLRFVARRDTAATVIDLDSIHHKVEDVSLTPYPEARALSVTMAYARRDGDDVVLFLTQTAGDDAAEAAVGRLEHAGERFDGHQVADGAALVVGRGNVVEEGRADDAAGPPEPRDDGEVEGPAVRLAGRAQQVEALGVGADLGDQQGVAEGRIVDPDRLGRDTGGERAAQSQRR